MIGSAIQAGGLLGRVYRNYQNKRKWSKYKEQPWNPPKKRPRIDPPKTPAGRVPAKYALAKKMTKFRKQKPAKEKVPKSAIVHYKDYGQFLAEKSMWINHEHWGHADKFWKGIGYGLTKTLLPKASIYNAKSMEDPCIGPRTNPLAANGVQYDNKPASTLLRLVFCTEAQSDGALSYNVTDIALEDTNASPDMYRSFDAIATDVANALKAKYDQDLGDRTWLQSAQFLIGADGGNDKISAQPIYVQNLDDAEIHLYVNTLIKFQNVTGSDDGSLDKHSIDANPLQGRMYTAKHHKPIIDGDLLNSGGRTLDTFFGDVSYQGNTSGFHLLGANSSVSNLDYGRIQHIPPAKELYGNQTVKTATLYMGPGAMKYHKTSFTMKKTFRQLAKINIANVGGEASHDAFGSHTMFAFGLAHRHGEDTIKVGFNRDQYVGCYVQHKRVVHPLKTNYTLDVGPVTTMIP